MSLRTVLVVALAVTCGASATIGVNYMRPKARDAAQETVPVVVAAVDISRGRTIGADDVVVRQWPKSMVLEGVLTSMEQALGRAALTSIFPGEPLLEKKLASKEAGRGLEALVPEGMRAYTIQAKTVAANVAGFVLPGNRVDVLLNLRGQSKDDDSGGGSTTTLLQSVEVLAVGQALDAPAENKVKDVQSVTLLVTPEQATLLDLGQVAGTLSLSLRNPVDTREAKTPPALLADIRYRQEKPLEQPEPGKVVPALAVEPEPEPVEHAIVTLRGPQRGQVWVTSYRKADSGVVPIPSQSERH